MKVIGYCRVRNEALILQETLDHWGQFCDSIYVFDDASTDETFSIANRHPKVARILHNDKWRPGVEQLGRQNGAIYELAINDADSLDDLWVVGFDADERLESFNPSFIEWANRDGFSGILTRLFDHYITPEDADWKYDGKLVNLRQMVGPEFRNQLLFFRWTPQVGYRNPVAREPNGVDVSKLVSSGFCRHFGKSISVEHWEETCDYYATYFPEPFRSKWLARKGKAIHTESDFGRPLLTWEKAMSGKAKLGPCLYCYRG